MKTALITTCIRPPRVLDLMRRYDPDVRFFVAGDLKSDDDEMLEWAGSMDEVVYLSADVQKHHKYKCSEIDWLELHSAPGARVVVGFAMGRRGHRYLGRR